MKQFYLSDMPVLGLFIYRKSLFQRLKMLIAGIFQVVKSFRFTNAGSIRNFVRVISGKKYFSKFCKGAKLFKLFIGLEKKKISSAFRVQNVNLVVLLSVCKTY
jgi:hypothetical protein